MEYVLMTLFIIGVILFLGWVLDSLDVVKPSVDSDIPKEKMLGYIAGESISEGNLVYLANISGLEAEIPRMEYVYYYPTLNTISLLYSIHPDAPGYRYYIGEL